MHASIAIFQGIAPNAVPQSAKCTSQVLCTCWIPRYTDTSVCKKTWSQSRNLLLLSLSLCLSVSPTFVWKLPSRRAQKGKSYQRFWRLHRNLLSPTPYLDIDLVNFDKTVRWRRREGERSDRKEPLYIQLSCMLTCDYMLLWKQRTAKGYTFPQFLHTLNDDKI